MPPRGAGGEAPVVLGDRHGGSMAETLVAAAERAARAAGFRVARNAPYAGGHITERHGRPARGLHALQLELDRSLYLAPDLRTTGPGFDRVARLIAAVAEALAAAASSRPRRSPPNKKDHPAGSEVAQVQGGAPRRGATRRRKGGIRRRVS